MTTSATCIWSKSLASTRERAITKVAFGVNDYGMDSQVLAGARLDLIAMHEALREDPVQPLEQSDDLERALVPAR
jgi:hypothetical protein